MTEAQGRRQSKNKMYYLKQFGVTEANKKRNIAQEKKRQTKNKLDKAV